MNKKGVERDVIVKAIILLLVLIFIIIFFTSNAWPTVKKFFGLVKTESYEDKVKLKDSENYFDNITKMYNSCIDSSKTNCACSKELFTLFNPYAINFSNKKIELINLNSKEIIKSTEIKINPICLSKIEDKKLVNDNLKSDSLTIYFKDNIMSLRDNSNFDVGGKNFEYTLLNAKDVLYLYKNSNGICFVTEEKALDTLSEIPRPKINYASKEWLNYLKSIELC